MLIQSNLQGCGELRRSRQQKARRAAEVRPHSSASPKNVGTAAPEASRHVMVTGYWEGEIEN
jgi:hypothetical protein